MSMVDNFKKTRLCSDKCKSWNRTRDLYQGTKEKDKKKLIGTNLKYIFLLNIHRKFKFWGVKAEITGGTFPANARQCKISMDLKSSFTFSLNSTDLLLWKKLSLILLLRHWHMAWLIIYNSICRRCQEPMFFYNFCLWDTMKPYITLQYTKQRFKVIKANKEKVSIKQNNKSSSDGVIRWSSGRKKEP